MAGLPNGLTSAKGRNSLAKTSSHLKFEEGLKPKI